MAIPNTKIDMENAASTMKHSSFQQIIQAIKPT